MSTKRSVGRTTATQAKVRCVSRSKKNRSPNLCAFTFADGRQCRTPRCSGHLHLCYFHAQKEAESLAAQQVGEDISRFLPTKLLTACDLGVAMSRLFCAVAQGQVKPKVATTLAYLAQTMLQSIPIAKHEYIESFDPDTWRSTVRSSFRHEDPDDADRTEDTGDAPADAPAPAPKTSPQSTASAPQAPVEAGLQPGSSSSSTSSPAHQPSAQPAPSPHTPLPPTSNEFAHQVMAGINSSQSEVKTPSEPETPTQSALSPEPGSSSSSSTPSSSDSTPAPMFSTQPPATSPASRPTPDNSQPAPTPPAPPTMPPGFGAPANWDVLIPPKPRRRFSRHWQLE